MALEGPIPGLNLGSDSQPHWNSTEPSSPEEGMCLRLGPPTIARSYASLPAMTSPWRARPMRPVVHKHDDPSGGYSFLPVTQGHLASITFNQSNNVGLPTMSPNIQSCTRNFTAENFRICIREKTNCTYRRTKLSSVVLKGTICKAIQVSSCHQRWRISVFLRIISLEESQMSSQPRFQEFQQCNRRGASFSSE